MTQPANIPDDAGDLGTFALEWLIWPERVAGRQRRDRLFAASDPKFGLRSQAFQDRMNTRFRHLKVDDIEAISNTLADNCRNREGEGAPVLPWIYQQCMNDAGVEFEFSSGIPAIRCAATRFERWRRLAERIDPDALVCLALASQFPKRELDDAAARTVAKWPIVFTTADHDLTQLMSKGVTDLHLHLKSLWPASLSWQRVLPHAVDRGEGKALEKLPAFKKLDRQSAEWKCLANVLARRRPGQRSYLERLRPIPVPFFEHVDLVPNSIGLLLQSERLMLIHAWLHILRTSRTITATNSD